jgi:hypothetical protein
MKRVASLVGIVGVVVIAACGGEPDPAKGTYTLRFPSTQAAVATDTVQVLLFDVPKDPTARANACSDLIASRKRRDTLQPAVTHAPVNICDLLAGNKPLTMPFGEHVVLAIAQRDAQDFLYGCNIQTLGDGDAPLPIALSLADIARPIPPTDCTTVAAFCSRACQ